MTDLIQLLPDAIANQIAAGEVIQRPASVVKELLENAVDAGSSEIKLIVKDAGKSLIQVIDNGCGMSETDARMSFERHATSKIKKADDLFAIRTMGFRGEALASIAAIAHVELKTRRHADDLGTRIVIEGTEIKKQEACQAAVGTNFSIKNLFYNVPARRNFLKSNTVEMRHILDEFQRIALANADIFFSLHHNNTEVFHLTAGNLRQRVVGVFGSSCNKKLVPVSEETDIIKLEGFVGKPEFAKKTRGEQLFFVNNRFIKSAYLNHAVVGAYEDLINTDSYPMYVIFLDIDPSKIDINVHPTKQEIKFEDEKLIYNYLKVAVRHALGQYSITPMLDFDQDPSISGFTSNASPKQSPTNFNQQTIGSKGNPGGGGNFSSSNSDDLRQANNLKNWEKLYEGLGDINSDNPPSNDKSSTPLTIESEWNEQTNKESSGESFIEENQTPLYQIHSTYILSQIKSGFMLIDQQAAHERILYENYLAILEEQQNFTQQELFPRTITLNTADSALLKEILPAINMLGFDIKDFGSDTFIIHGTPADLNSSINEQQIIEMLLQQYKSNMDLKLELKENIARSMAQSASIKRGQPLSNKEMKALIDQLFACNMPYKSPTGRSCFLTYDMGELEKLFLG